MWTRDLKTRGAVLHSKQSEDSWQKKADYQEGLEESRADSAARSRDSYMKDPEKSCALSRESYMKNQEKNRADSAAQSWESYKNDLEKSHDDSAVRSREHRRRNRVA